MSRADLRLLFARVAMLLLPWMLIFSRAGAEICGGLIGVLFLWHSARMRDWEWIRTPTVRVALIAWVWLMLVVSPLAVNPEKSFLMALPWIRYILLFAAMRYWLLRTRQSLKLLGITLAVMLAGCAIDTIWQYATGVSLSGQPVWESGRLTGPMHAPRIGIFMAKFILPVLALLSVTMPEKKIAMPLALFVLTGVAGVSILLTGERMAFGMMAASLGLAMVLLAWHLKQSRRYLFGAMALLLTMTAVVFSTQTWVQHSLERTQVNMGNFAASPYGQVFQGALEVGQAHWMTGAGLNGFRVALPQLKAQRGEATPSEGFLHPHNPYLEWFAEAGLPGLGLWIILVLTLLREAMHRLNRMDKTQVMVPIAMLAACLMNFFPLMVSQSYFLNWSAILLWYTLGVVYSAGNGVNEASFVSKARSPA